MIVLPLFWDQHDNAQRVDELGLGRRLDTYGHEPEQLLDAVAALLAETGLAGRLARISARLQAEPGTVKAADLIEAVARG
jgi:UDP:flavonoid glycosyltransferase YjiC (YdhE family)